MVAAPFLALLCVVVESAFIALAQQSLDMTISQAVRQLRTGGFQENADGSDPGQRLRRVVCNGPVILFPCNELRLDVSNARSFSTSQPAEPFDPAAKSWASGFGTRFDCPQGGNIVTVRAAVPILRTFKYLDFTGRGMPDNTQMLISTAIFQAESYESKPC